MVTQFSWSSKRKKAALALAEGQSQQAVAEAIGVCRKTICNWLCVTEFLAEVDRLSCMIDISSRAERLRFAMRVVRQKVREDGTLETEKDLLDWLKYAQSETTGIKLGFSKGEVAEMDAQIDAAWRESVEEEVQRRLAERELIVQVQPVNDRLLLR
ncbi:MAG TPA: helix-turn-helix domain-containing protein [Pyrinomonadaceae bacterium]|nr:helix-turn-helix domain-containing protein [Pyrinomonadaceae bacterium]